MYEELSFGQERNGVARQRRSRDIFVAFEEILCPGTPTRPLVPETFVFHGNAWSVFPIRCERGDPKATIIRGSPPKAVVRRIDSKGINNPSPPRPVDFSPWSCPRPFVFSSLLQHVAPLAGRRQSSGRSARTGPAPRWRRELGQRRSEGG